jgi:hypothetical protein
MEAQATLVDDEVPPDIRHQFLLADELGCTLDKSNQ